MIRLQLVALPLLLLIACKEKSSPQEVKIKQSLLPAVSTVQRDTNNKAIHVFVALCDNKYQGIVPVPAGIGNGQDPASNLYWGAGYGVKSFFIHKSRDWQLITAWKNPVANILERLLLKHRSKDIYLLADAYDGRFIRQATINFFTAASGNNEIEIEVKGKKIFFGGAADLIAYVGHDGLMDFSLEQAFKKSNDKPREAIMLACYSKNYFSPHLKQGGATPLLWTSGLMAPEAYTLHDAIHEWANNSTPQQVRLAAARAYAKYQHCSLKAAQNLLVQGW